MNTRRKTILLLFMLMNVVNSNLLHSSERSLLVILEDFDQADWNHTASVRYNLKSFKSEELEDFELEELGYNIMAESAKPCYEKYQEIDRQTYKKKSRLISELRDHSQASQDFKWGYDHASDFLLDLMSSQLGRVIKGDCDAYNRREKIKNDYEEKYGESDIDFNLDENFNAQECVRHKFSDSNWQKEHTKVKDLVHLYDRCQATTDQNWKDLEESLK